MQVNIKPIGAILFVINVKFLILNIKFKIESKAIKIYLFSFRNYGHFHEVGIERIARDIFECIKPKFIRVIGDFNKRGGISITPITELGDKSYSHTIPIPPINYGA